MAYMGEKQENKQKNNLENNLKLKIESSFKSALVTLSTGKLTLAISPRGSTAAPAA